MAFLKVQSIIILNFSSKVDIELEVSWAISILLNHAQKLGPTMWKSQKIMYILKSHLLLGRKN